MGAAGLSAVVAANVKNQVLHNPWDWLTSTIVAIFSFLTSTLGAQARGSRYDHAAREMEKATAAYETDSSVTDVDLGKAEQKGIDMLIDSTQ